MQAHRPWRSLAVSLAALALVTGYGRAQAQLASEADLNKNFRGAAEAKIGTLASGNQQPGKDDQAAIDAAADWYTLRLATGKFTPVQAEKFQKEVATFISRTQDTAALKGNAAFIRRISPAMVDRLQRVFAEDFDKGTLDTRLMIINTAAILPQVARLRDETIGELLVELMKDQGKGKKEDGALRGPEIVRLYAARGLKEFMPLRGISDGDFPLKKKEIDLKARESSYVVPLVQLIERQLAPNLPTV